jgi:hypothetical protein
MSAGLDDGAAAIRLAPRPVSRGPGRAADREIVDHADADHPRILVVVPNPCSYQVLAAMRAAYRAGQADVGTDPRHDDPRWWTSTCSRCDGTEFHTADCREAESVRCEHCDVAVVAYKAEAAAEPGWWHSPACPLFASREPDAEVAIAVLAKLAKAQFHRVLELLGRPPERYKEWCSGPYHFGSSPAYGPVTVELADAVCAYLEDIGVPHERETTTRWRP